MTNQKTHKHTYLDNVMMKEKKTILEEEPGVGWRGSKQTNERRRPDRPHRLNKCEGRREEEIERGRIGVRVLEGSQRKKTEKPTHTHTHT